MTDTPPISQHRPLVTFALFAYNQEKFIRQAVEGAFAQTYSPLEIILSDDNSSDQTFEIMQEMARAYVGPHKVTTLRNPINLGIGKHVNKVLDKCAGEWIALAAGDDISYPERVDATMAHVSNTKTRIDGIVVQLEEIDETGRSTGVTHNIFNEDADILKDAIKGAGLTVSRATKTNFPQFLSGVENEDIVLCFRSMMLSNLYFLPNELVKYRVVRRSMMPFYRFSFSSDWRDRQMKHMLSAIAAFKQLEIDREHVSHEFVAGSQAELFFNKKSSEARNARILLDIITKKNFWSIEVALAILRSQKLKKALVWRYYRKLTGQFEIPS